MLLGALRVGKIAKVTKQPESQADVQLPEVSKDPKSLKVVETVPVSLLRALKRGLVTTQQSALYSTNTSSTRRVNFSAKTKPSKDE